MKIAQRHRKWKNKSRSWFQAQFSVFLPALTTSLWQHQVSETLVNWGNFSQSCYLFLKTGRNRPDETFPWVTVWWTFWRCYTHRYTVFLRTAPLFPSSDGIYSWGNLFFSVKVSRFYVGRSLFNQKLASFYFIVLAYRVRWRKQEACPKVLSWPCGISRTLRHTLAPCEDRLTPFIITMQSFTLFHGPTHCWTN